MTHDFSHPEYLYRLARSGSMADREALALAVTSLLRTSLTSTEKGLAQDILLHLLNEAETDLRRALAEQLAYEPNCPQALLDFLIYENPFSVAESVLRYSDVLTDEYLIDVVKCFDSADYWLALAGRKHIGEDLSRFLIGTDHPGVFETLVNNKGAHFCPIGTAWLIQAAAHLPSIQSPLIARPEVTVDLAVQLYWYVSEELRKEIQKRFAVDSKILDQAMEHIVRRRLALKKETLRITPEAHIAAMRLKEENNINSRQILEALKKGDRALFVCLWGSLLNLNPETVLVKIQEDFVTALTVLAHSSRITRSDYNRMFLRWRRLQPDLCVRDVDLTEVMRFFDQMNFEKARRIILSWHDMPPLTAQ